MVDCGAGQIAGPWTPEIGCRRACRKFGEAWIAARLALIVGPTPGHVFPALAVADAIRDVDVVTEVVLIGPSDGEATRLIDPGRYRIEAIRAAPLARQGVLGRARAAQRIVGGVRDARRLFAQEGIQMVIGFGSYASGAAVLAGRSLGLLTAIHEANSTPGMANRLVGKRVDRVYLGVELPRASWYRPAQARVVGLPVRREIAALAGVPRHYPEGRALRVLVVGGAWGAPFLAREVPPVLGRVAQSGASLEVWHQVGSAPVAPIARAYANAGLPARLVPNIDDMAEAYRWADFAIARSGAGVIAELAVTGIPALLVPWSEAADDHQAGNARAFAQAGAGAWVSERDWSGEAVAAQLYGLLVDAEHWRQASAVARSTARPHAAEALARDALSLLKGLS
jgi:UDP-N-acetylglucosamine--N-acetylmuramyl-(pentapeptide) pyrophosphoryl-undecaprenol N-acetylglucosamine transferase